jgi:hypothetical protein
MRIELHCPQAVTASAECRLQAILFNDSYEPVAVSRNAFVGPNVRALAAGIFPQPESVEATFGQADEPLMLQPFTFYGRERSFSLQPGEIEVTAYYRDSNGETLTASQKITIQG